MRISDWSSDVCSSDLVGVKAGRRGQRQDVAVLDIDHNGRSLSFGRQSPHYGFLEPKIQRRRDVSAGNGGFARKLADWAPRGVDLHIPDAWAAAQRRTDGSLQARLSDQGHHHKRRGVFLEIRTPRLDIEREAGREREGQNGK